MWAYLPEIIAVLLGAIVGITSLSPEGRRMMRALMRNFVSGTLDTAVPLVRELSGVLREIVAAFRDGSKIAGPAIFAEVKQPFSDFAQEAFKQVSQNLLAKGKVSPEHWTDNAGEAMGDAFSFGLSSFAVSAAMEALFPKSIHTLNGMGPVLASLAGFGEVAKAALGPLFDAAITAPATADLNRTFRPTSYALGGVLALYARGLITREVAVQRLIFQGYPDEQIEALLAGSFSPVASFVLRGALKTGALSDDELRNVMTYMGMRSIDQERLIRVGKALALEPYQRGVVIAVGQAFERGTITEQEFLDSLQHAAIPDGAQDLVNMTARYRKIRQLATLYIESVETAYQYGQITDAQFVPLLEQGGINEADANAHYAIASAKKHGREMQAAEREAAREAAAVQRLAIQTAIAGFMAGTLDAAGLSAAILLAGVSATQAALLVTLTTLRKQGKQRLLYGLLLEPSAAQLLQEQVNEVHLTFTKGFIDYDGALAALQNLGITETYAEPLVNVWDLALSSSTA
jgi:hypothetical protein